MNAAERTFADALRELVEEATVGRAAGWDGSSVQTFREAGVLSTNAGLLIRLEDGATFQVTIVQSR